MAPPKRPWFRCYTETFADPNLRALPVSHRWLWLAILGMARESPIAGALLDKGHKPLTQAHMAAYASVKPSEVNQGVARFLELGMLWADDCNTFAVTNWDTRQFESDDVASRVAKHRARNADVTPDGTLHGSDDVTVPPSVGPSEVQSSRELEREELPPSRPSQAAALIAPGREPSLSIEVEAIVAALIDVHGPAKVEAAVQQLVDDRRKFPWPSDARKALEAILGPSPVEPQAHVLDDAQRAQRAIAERDGQAWRDELASTAEPTADEKARVRQMLAQRRPA